MADDQGRLADVEAAAMDPDAEEATTIEARVPAADETRYVQTGELPPADAGRLGVWYGSDNGVLPAYVFAPTYAKLTKVLAEVTRLTKRGQHQQGWSYLVGGDLVDMVRPLLAKNGLALSVRPGEVSFRKSPSQNGKTDLMHVDVALAIVDGKTGQRIEESTWCGESYDGDKAWKVCVTYAVRSYLANVCLVTAEGGGDPEQGEDNGHRPPRNEKRPRPQGDGGDSGSWPKDLKDTFFKLKDQLGGWDPITEKAKEFGYKGRKLFDAPVEIGTQVAEFFLRGGDK